LTNCNAETMIVPWISNNIRVSFRIQFIAR